MVNISCFMAKADDVAACKPEDTIRTALDLMLTRKVGSVVVLDLEKSTRPVGIITKTDLLESYQKGHNLDRYHATEIMKVNLTAVLDTMSKDDAAKVMEKNKLHHAMVCDKDGNFVGVISSLDIAGEVAKDSRAWPWIRPDSGKITMTPISPRGPVEHHQDQRSSFTQIIDNLQYADM